MRIAFTKMHGAGNDFVMIDNRSGSLRLTTEQIARLCHRRFGIGADGLLLLEKPADAATQDARMVYYNADGSRAEMCGNGARCFTAFALAHQVGTPDRVRFLTDAGLITATVRGDQITIQMTAPVTSAWRELRLVRSSHRRGQDRADRIKRSSGSSGAGGDQRSATQIKAATDKNESCVPA